MNTMEDPIIEKLVNTVLIESDNSGNTATEGPIITDTPLPVKDEVRNVLKKVDSSGNIILEHPMTNSDRIIPAVIKNIRSNFLFYSVFTACVWYICRLTNHSFIWGMLTAVIASLDGYLIHWYAHNFSWMEQYNKLDNVITMCKPVSYLAEKWCYLMDFHRKTHHDSRINKQYKNLFMEFLNNIAGQGFFVLFGSYVARRLNLWIVVLWALLYATAHNINYDLLLMSNTHMTHHLTTYTNYGIDIYDILFNTKYDFNNIERYNHYAINLVIITMMIIGIIRYINKKTT